jgi:hypothetical protein
MRNGILLALIVITLITGCARDECPCTFVVTDKHTSVQRHGAGVVITFYHITADYNGQTRYATVTHAQYDRVNVGDVLTIDADGSIEKE